MASAGTPDLEISSALQQAVGLLGSDPAAAETLIRPVIAADPDNPDARLILGAAFRARRAFGEALAVLEPLAADRPDSWIVQAELGQTLFALGRSGAAIEPLTRATTLNPGWAQGWRLLADIKLFACDLDGAQRADDGWLRAIVQEPTLQGAAAALAEGRPADAEPALIAALQAAPHSTQTAHLLGEALARLNRLPEAERLLDACVRNAPRFDPARLAYAVVLERLGRGAQALPHVEALLARSPANLRLRIMKYALLCQTGDQRGGSEILKTLLAEIPDQPRAWIIYGHGLRTIGKIAESVAAFHRCLELDPAFAEAYWALANLKAYRFTEDEHTAMAALLERPDLADEARAHLRFSLGSASEAAGRYARAFTHFAEGNRIEHARRGYAPDLMKGWVERSKALFTPAFFKAREGSGAHSPDPIFIVGLPRSGSTLVAQILSSHPAIESTRELDDIQMIADFVSGLKAEAYPDALAPLTRDDAAKLGRDYLERTRPLRRLGRSMFIDKAPWNFVHTGLIQLILPKARIIDVRRHPLSCCISVFKQHFAAGSGFSYDLTDLGRYYADYVALMAHYDAVLPGRVHRVFYEDLVQDTEAEVRKLLAYVGQPFDPACLRFFENPQAVPTPSSEQVRQPIFADAMDLWREYEPWLGPLKAALGPVLDAYPAAPEAARTPPPH